jgi:hypothetical protein
MMWNTHLPVRPAARAALLCLALTLASGCDRAGVRHYVVPKDGAAPAPAAPAFARPNAVIHWKELPAGWAETQGTRASAAAFRITGADGSEAGLTATPLPLMTGREADLINIYREMAQQAALPEAEALALLQPVEIAGREGKIFDILGKMPGDEAEQKIVTAIAAEPDASWFFKLSGPPALVDAQRAAFIGWLKGVSFAHTPMASSGGGATSAPAAPGASGFKWTVPEGWTELAPGAMQAAKFTVPAAGEARAEVSVSIFPSDTGGNLANVNRWRGQLGLPPIEGGQLGEVTQPLDPALSGAILVDMTNNGMRMLGAVVPRGGRWFFYKLLGAEAAVAPQKEAFLRFVKSEP